MTHRGARRAVAVFAIERRSATPLACAIVLIGLAAGGQAEASDVLRWIPAGTRVVLDVDPAASARQPRTREALGLDALLGANPARRSLSRAARRVTVAYVAAGSGTTPVVFAHGAGGLGRTFASLRGPSLGRSGDHDLYASRDVERSALALLAPDCVVEGEPAALRAVLSGPAGRQELADLPAEGAHRRLCAISPAGAPVSLLYLSRGGGADLYAICKDLERVLGAELGEQLDSYQVPLRMLGTTQGVRLDLRQERDDLATVLQLAMPNRMAAQVTQASLTAGRDLVRLASEAAVKANTLTASDARQLDAALATLQATASGDVVRVQLRLADPAEFGAR
jgi:hypothetical protein